MFNLFAWTWAMADTSNMIEWEAKFTSPVYYAYYNSLTCKILDVGFYDPNDMIHEDDI